MKFVAFERTMQGTGASRRLRNARQGARHRLWRGRAGHDRARSQRPVPRAEEGSLPLVAARDGAGRQDRSRCCCATSRCTRSGSSVLHIDFQRVDANDQACTRRCRCTSAARRTRRRSRPTSAWSTTSSTSSRSSAWPRSCPSSSTSTWRPDQGPVAARERHRSCPKGVQVVTPRQAEPGDRRGDAAKVEAEEVEPKPRVPGAAPAACAAAGAGRPAKDASKADARPHQPRTTRRSAVERELFAAPRSGPPTAGRFVLRLHSIIATMIRLIVGLGNPGPEYEAPATTPASGGSTSVARKLERLAAARARLPRPGGARQPSRGAAALAARADDLHEPVGQVGRGAGALLQDRSRTRSWSRTTSSTCCPARSSSSSAAAHAGHNGLKDIHAQLGSADFWRLRLGIGHPGVKAEVIDCVLKKPSPEQREAIEKCIEQALDGARPAARRRHGARDDEDPRHSRRGPSRRGPTAPRRAEPCRDDGRRAMAAALLLALAGLRRGSADAAIYRCGTEGRSYSHEPCRERHGRSTRRRAARSGRRSAPGARRRVDARGALGRASMARERRAREAADGRRREPALGPAAAARRRRKQLQSAKRPSAAKARATSAPSRRRSRPVAARRRALRPRLGRGLGLQAPVLGPQRLARLDVLPGRPGCRPPGRPARTAARRSGRRTRCTARIDHVDLRAHRDRLVRALGLADIAVDALVGDHQGHERSANAVQASSARLTRCCSRSSTEGDTNLETSPPRVAISRTKVPRDELVLVARRHEDGLDIGHQLAVHAGHLELVLEVAHRAQAAHHHLAAVLDHEVAQQAAKRHHLDVRIRARPARVAMSSRSAIVNIVRLWWPAATATIRRSNSRLARRIRSSWPSVIGSKVPGIDGGQAGRGGHVRGVLGVPPMSARSVAAPLRPATPGAAGGSGPRRHAPARHGSRPPPASGVGVDRLGRLDVDEAARRRSRAAAAAPARQQRRVERRVEEARGRSAPAGARAIHASASARSTRTASALSRCLRSPQAARPAPGRARAARPRRAARRRLEAERARCRRRRRGSASRSGPGRAS